jgi:hypothetical protein
MCHFFAGPASAVESRRNPDDLAVSLLITAARSTASTRQAEKLPNFDQKKSRNNRLAAQFESNRRV